MLAAGNIIGTSWDNIAAPIVQDCIDVDVAYAQLTGYPMTDIWCNGVLWKSIITNTEVRNLAGSSNQPFAEFSRDPETGMDGVPGNQYIGVLRGLPTVRWHIYNHGLSLGGNLIDVSKLAVHLPDCGVQSRHDLGGIVGSDLAFAGSARCAGLKIVLVNSDQIHHNLERRIRSC